MKDARDRGGQEPINAFVEVKRVPDVQELREGRRMEGERNFCRHRIRAAVLWIGVDRASQRQVPGRRRRPGQPKPGNPGSSLGRRGRLDLGRRQEVRERVEVVTDADPTLGAGLQRHRSTAGERVQDDVPRSAVARDERVCQGRGEARQVRAHRMERVAP